jgi:hypothetical protein
MVRYGSLPRELSTVTPLPADKEAAFEETGEHFGEGLLA